MKYKVGDKVKIVSLQSDRGCCMDVVGDIGEIIEYDSSSILKYKVKIEYGGSWWWEESNLELIEDVKPKFKKGDKVIRVGDTSAIGVNFGEVYTVDNPSSHSGFYGGELHNHVTLVEVESSPSDKYLELYVEQRNNREMTPNDLISISINGVEFDQDLILEDLLAAETPIIYKGDTVTVEDILGVTNGYHGARIWEALRKPFDTECFVQDMDTVVEFRDKQKEALDYFFQPYYDKQQQEKDELKTLIAFKMEEVDALVKQLNQM